jgi:hypothetical protein
MLFYPAYDFFLFLAVRTPGPFAPGEINTFEKEELQKTLNQLPGSCDPEERTHILV